MSDLIMVPVNLIYRRRMHCLSGFAVGIIAVGKALMCFLALPLIFTIVQNTTQNILHDVGTNK